MLTVAQRRHDSAMERPRMPRAWRQGDEPVPGYHLVQYLGRGDAGEVWHAHGPGGIDVAFKIVRVDEKAAIPDLRLLERLKKARHPNLVPLLGLWVRDFAGNVVDRNSRTLIDAPTTPEFLFLVTALGEQSVLDRLRDCQRHDQAGIPGVELIGYLEDAARALDYLHSPRHDLGQGPVAVIHGGIKPQNLLMVGGAVQVSEVGLAQTLARSHVVTSLAAAAPFCAPEACHGEPGPLADQYSLAVTFHFLRTGSLPFSSDDPAVIAAEAQEGQLDLSRLSVAEQQVIRRATSRRPEARYPNCLDFTRELRLAIEQSSPLYDGLVIEANREVVPGYRLIRLLGRGAFGEVWEAHAPGRLPVALKIIEGLDRASSRGRQEFRALELIKGLSHNGLMELRSFWLLDRHGRPIPDDVRGHASAPSPATLVIATRLADKTLGQVLDQYKDQGRPGVPPEELIGYFREVAAALDFLNAARHQLGHRRVAIQHRDVKPDNIMLAGDAVKLTDFGLAKVMDTEHVPAEIRPDSVGFTFHYAAPEVLRGKVTRWSDQYSLAITYYELRTGRLPYGRQGSAYQQMMRQLEGRLELNLLPKSERDLITRATSVTPEERFPTCTAFVEALARIPAYDEVRTPGEGELARDEQASPGPLAIDGKFQGRGSRGVAVLDRPMRPRTMPVVLHRGEEYPPPAPDTEPDWDYIPLAVDTSPDSSVQPLLPAEGPTDLDRVTPLKAYWLPLSVVFLLGIGLAVVVHSVLKQVRKGSTNQVTSLTPRLVPSAKGPVHAEPRPRQDLRPAGRVVTFKPAVDDQPIVPVSLAPPELPPVDPTPPPPLFILGKNVRDDDFPSFLANNLNGLISRVSKPAEFDEALRALSPLPQGLITQRLLAFRAECHLEGTGKHLAEADAILKEAVTLGEPTAYVQYLQARLFQEKTQPVPAALALEEALRRDLSLTGFRRDRARTIVSEATSMLPSLTAPGQLELRRCLGEIQDRLR